MRYGLESDTRYTLIIIPPDVINRRIIHLFTSNLCYTFTCDDTFFLRGRQCTLFIEPYQQCSLDCDGGVIIGVRRGVEINKLSNNGRRSVTDACARWR